ncbi:PREDICTED: uncharacterized protein LOC106147211 [Chinchilla lanigera]|uniref:uncharacterized protein LOC106147211 n=1 Tax=Chinchilla lanigera TaxID=34839 RepID=UPI0006970FA5|nr:PREDICTED: uncharacterized protein LOC106147211 [Chinchilla lanigera]
MFPRPTRRRAGLLLSPWREGEDGGGASVPGVESQPRTSSPAGPAGGFRPRALPGHLRGGAILSCPWAGQVWGPKWSRAAAPQRAKGRPSSSPGAGQWRLEAIPTCLRFPGSGQLPVTFVPNLTVCYSPPRPLLCPHLGTRRPLLGWRLSGGTARGILLCGFTCGKKRSRSLVDGRGRETSLSKLRLLGKPSNSPRLGCPFLTSCFHTAPRQKVLPLNHAPSPPPLPRL